MKNLLFLLILLINSVAYSQTSIKNFYVVEKENSTIAPTTKNSNSSGTLNLTFTQSSLQDFFSVRNVYKYEKPFIGTRSQLLKRTFLVSINDEPNILNSLKSLTGVEFVEEIPDPILLYYPNDIDVGNIGNDRALELVRAPMAWEVTTGNPNILVGIPDTGFNTNHEELSGKIVQHIGTTDINGFHGTMVSGFAAANTNNSIGVASIGFNSKLVTAQGFTVMAHQIAQIPGIRVINTSWVTNCSYSVVEEETYREIWEDFGVIVVSAAGNGGTCGGPNNYVYPSAYKNYTIAVSSVGTSFPIGTIYTDANGVQYQIEWNDVHQNGINLSNPEVNTHQHNDKVDLVAPGYAIPGGIMGNNVYTKCWGTSCASPQVAAAAALILSLNPNLTPNQVKNIIKNTTDDIYWIPYNQPYIGKLGTGRLNVFRAVKETKCMSEANPTVNFMIKDSKEDVGHEPNNNTQYMWTSSDILVRNQNDGKLIPVHQNPTYDGVNPNYIYVRVTNIGCQTSSGNDTVTVNWAKASTSLNYPDYWDGTRVQNGVVFGGLVGSGVIPVLKPGQEALVEIPWNVPNPQDYSQINPEPWHFCLLAKINSSDDLLSSPMTPNPNIMVRNNNNLAWKNVTVVNIAGTGSTLGGVIAIANPHNTIKNYDLELVKEDIETGKPVYEEAEVGIKMDDVLLAAWKRGGESSVNTENTNFENKKIIAGNNVLLKNINLYPNTMGTLYVSFNFLTKESTNKEKYRYHIIQKDSETGEIMGGETFEIHKQERSLFVANAGNNIEAEKNETVTLHASDINETATYNWYDEDGNLIYTGKSFSVSQDITKKYKLEVVALDGFKDYTEIEVKVSPYKFINMAPNPASSQILLQYDIENSTSAYFIITGLSNNLSNNYILNTSTSQYNVNLTNYPAGQYTVVLVVDGKVISSKNLIKN